MNDRKQHWEQVYTNRSPLEVSWYQAEPALSLALIERSRAGKEAAVIDIGGGASLLVDRLLARGYRQLAVLDISGTALDVARKRLGAEASAVEWIESDITRFRAARQYAVWHDRAVFHFLTDPGDRRRYVEALRRSLAAGGQAIIAAFAPGGPTRCSNLDIVQYDAARLQAELGPEFRLEEQQGESHTTPAGKVQEFLYFRWSWTGRPGDAAG